MSKQLYDDKTIAQYLLGFLSETEAERFDKLSVTDDQFADALRIAEKDLVDAYVQGELTGPDRDRFKTYYLSSPLRRSNVEFAQAFRVWAEQNAVAELRPESLDELRKKRGWFAAFGFFSAPRLAWGLAIAALLLFVAGGLLVFQNLRLRQQINQTQARQEELRQREQELQKEIDAQHSSNAQTEQELARVRDERERLEQELNDAQAASPSGKGGIVSLNLAPPMRAAGQIHTISIPPGTNLVAAQLQLEAADYSAYRVALVNPADGRALWQSGNLKARTKGDRKMISVKFPAHLLKSQNYSLRVSGVAAGGASEIVSDYSFKVMK